MDTAELTAEETRQLENIMQWLAPLSGRLKRAVSRRLSWPAGARPTVAEFYNSEEWRNSVEFVKTLGVKGERDVPDGVDSLEAFATDKYGEE